MPTKLSALPDPVTFADGRYKVDQANTFGDVAPTSHLTVTCLVPSAGAKFTAWAGILQPGEVATDLNINHPGTSGRQVSQIDGLPTDITGILWVAIIHEGSPASPGQMADAIGYWMPSRKPSIRASRACSCPTIIAPPPTRPNSTRLMVAQHGERSATTSNCSTAPDGIGMVPSGRRGR